MTKNNSIAELLNGNNIEPLTGEKIYYVSRDDIIRDPENDRDDWDDPATIANIESIKKSAAIRLNDGRRYGVRTALWVKPADEQGKYMLIDGECRWRSTWGEEDPEALMLPIIIRTGDAKEIRLDHTSSNGARKGLNLYQVARSIKRDQDEYGLSSDEIMAVHNLQSKSQLSKFNAIHKLGDSALELVRAGYFQDINLVYDLKKLDDDGITKLKKKIEKGDSIQQALKTLMPKEKTRTADAEGKQDGGGSTPAKVALNLPLAEAQALAILLEVDAELEPKELRIALLAKIAGLVESTDEQQDAE
ncbi:hypothetical protein LZ023_40585 (plasmid) [Pseudomonas silvicola]|nr:hypothetical protein LZ023_40860 [Pseudomonas silvicola]WAH62232.1 hypothetical protein LZ023_40585 [Pseudomonas silvicola]